MRFVIFETVKVLISLMTHVTFVRFLFLHPNSPWIRLVVIGVKDREGTISILLESLILVAVSFVILQSVGISIGLVCNFVSLCVDLNQN